MRRTLNRPLIEAGRQTVVTRFPKDVDLRWEAYLQLHCNAQDMGVLDSELHNLLDQRLAFFEEGSKRVPKGGK